METLFKTALANLMDRTETFTRSEWANYLLVSEPAISQWTKGKTMPRAEYLKTILLYLENFDRPNVQGCIKAFHEMADLPIEQTLDVDLRVRYRKYQTITEYITVAYKDVLNIEISDVKGCFRKELFYLFSAFARSIKEVANDLVEVDQALILSKALKAIDQKELGQLLIKQLAKQVEPKLDLIPNAEQNAFIDDQQWKGTYLARSVNCVRKPQLFYSFIKPEPKTMESMPATMNTTALSLCVMNLRQITSQSRFWKIERVLKVDELRHLLERISAGDKEAFKKIFELCYKDVKWYLSENCAVELGVEEIVQNVFVTVWRNKRRLEKMDDFGSFLFQIADMCLQVHQIERIKSSEETVDPTCCFIDNDLREGLEVVRNMELSKA